MCVVEKKQAFVARHNLSMSDQCLDKMFRSLSNAKGLDEELFLDMMASKPYLKGSLQRSLNTTQLKGS